MKAHKYTLHGGKQKTLDTVFFWVTKGKQTVKKLISSCLLCKKVEGRPCIYPSPSYALHSIKSNL